jgi:hypothetical protein
VPATTGFVHADDNILATASFIHAVDVMPALNMPFF